MVTKRAHLSNKLYFPPVLIKQKFTSAEVLINEPEPNTNYINQPTEGIIVTKKEIHCKRKTFKQHCFLAVSFRFTSYLMKNAIKNNVRKSTEMPLHNTHKIQQFITHKYVKGNLEPS